VNFAQWSWYQVECVQFDGSLLHPGANQITLGLRHAMPFSAPIEQRSKFLGKRCDMLFSQLVWP
jgi:hypothetical protein